MSRSVSMPTSRSWSPQTGSGPTSKAFILWAASWSEWVGRTHSAPLVITLLTSMAVLPGRATPSVRFGPGPSLGRPRSAGPWVRAGAIEAGRAAGPWAPPAPYRDPGAHAPAWAVAEAGRAAGLVSARAEQARAYPWNFAW